MLLPVEAVAVWQRHLTEQEADRQRREQEKALGEHLPQGRRAPVCPTCKSSFLQVAYTGPVIISEIRPRGARRASVTPL